MKNQFDLSFVIPAKDEQDSVTVLHDEIIEVLSKIDKTAEIIYIDDGSIDNTFNALEKIRREDNRVKIIRLRGNFGKSIALQTGFEYATGALIVTMDADLQDDPKELPEFLKKIDTGCDLVSGWKKNRHDPWHKVIPSRILNFITLRLTGVRIHDINCGFKVYKKEVAQNLTLYGELYRFIPILAAKQNYKVDEVIVDHRPRKYGKSKFGAGRNIKGLLDLLTIVFLTGYLSRPGHFFGTLGIASFSLGFIIGLYITYLRITTGGIQYRQPLLYLGVLLMIIGIQFISTGLLAELITSFNQKNISSESNIKQIID